MIEHISIKNFAVIKNTEIDFEEGLNIITGETGSGKSIVVEAISLALGSRADSSYIREGADKAEIQLKASLDQEEYVIIRRISRGGRNLCLLNGEIVTLAELSRTAEKLAAIHGQYDNQTLLDPENHLHLVDSYMPDQTGPAYDAFIKAYNNYKETRESLRKLEQNIRETKSRQDFYRFQKKEIEQAELKPGEDRELEEKIQLLQNGERVYSALEQTSLLLTEQEGSALTLLGEAKDLLADIRNTSGEFREISTEFDEAYYSIEELSGRIRSAIEKTQFTPGELDQTISRLDLIDGLKKKYGGEIPDILHALDDVNKKLSSLETSDENRTQLEQEQKHRLEILKEKTSELTEVRRSCASAMGKKIEKELSDLNFKNPHFRIEFQKAPAITRDGGDLCEIMLSTNPGEPLKPLVKVASGGEISRIMLAIRNVTAGRDQLPTMIFDEIDTGISGITASVIARKLREIAKKHQIICITHLPQIASAGDANFRIRKDVRNGRTYTDVEPVTKEGKTDEIARLLAGDQITEITRKSAGELIDSMMK